MRNVGKLLLVEGQRVRRRQYDLLEVIREYWSLAPGVSYKFYKSIIRL